MNDAPRYRHVAWAYDALASGYSLGAIDRAKRHHHSLINRGDRVLYAGAGRGKEIVAACQRGAKVTCVEPCPAMASKLHARLSNAADGFTLMPKPIQSIPAEPVYDVVAAHFFLNVFDEVAMPSVLEHLCRFVKPGGHLVIADFKPNSPQTSLLMRMMRAAYYRPLNLAGWLLRICALHPVYDYEPILITNGLVIEQQTYFKSVPCMQPLYIAVTSRKP